LQEASKILAEKGDVDSAKSFLDQVTKGLPSPDLTRLLADMNPWSETIELDLLPFQNFYLST
jgi:hypothetical protein